jgi:hypothetical protein
MAIFVATVKNCCQRGTRGTGTSSKSQKCIKYLTISLNFNRTVRIWIFLMDPDPWILNSELLIRIQESQINAYPEHCILSSFEELQGERSYESFWQGYSKSQISGRIRNRRAKQFRFL